MKSSKFNVLHKEKSNLIIYNTLSGGILRLDDDYAQSFLDFLDTQNELNLKTGLTDTLKKGLMVVDDDIDEIECLKVMNNLARYSGVSLGLTIAPTTKCNFACNYCYEHDINYFDMTSNVENRLINFIEEHMAGRNKLSITWYGGEPLLNIESIENISRKVINLKYDYSAQIVTNGYFLSKDVAIRLSDLYVKHVQITLDGTAELHDQRRFLKSGESTFYKILHNIKECCEILSIIIRVNVDKNNINNVSKLLDVLNEYGLQGKVSLYISPVDNKKGSKCNINDCFSNEEFSLEALKFYQKNINSGYVFFNVPLFKTTGCGAVNSSSYVIDPLGDIYKCWDDIGIATEKIGSIFEKTINLTSKALKWLSYDMLENDECCECKFLPVCMGGCPNKPIKGNERKCIPFKYYPEKYLSLLLRDKKFTI